MLDFVNFPEMARNVTRYTPNDPMQINLRKMLSDMSDDCLAKVESDLDFYQRQGLLPARLEELLFGNSEALAA